MQKEFVANLFEQAGIKVLAFEQIKNQYWPEAYTDMIEKNPWWLVTTRFGIVKIGNRKRVTSIGWKSTGVRGKVTEDGTTCENTYVHAWTDEDAVIYLTNLHALAVEQGKVLSDTEILTQLARRAIEMVDNLNDKRRVLSEEIAVIEKRLTAFNSLIIQLS